jgi:hypothetical protein
MPTRGIEHIKNMKDFFVYILQIKNWSHAKKHALIDNSWDLLKVLAKKSKNRCSIPRDARFTRSSGRTD